MLLWVGFVPQSPDVLSCVCLNVCFFPPGPDSCSKACKGWFVSVSFGELFFGCCRGQFVGLLVTYYTFMSWTSAKCYVDGGGQVLNFDDYLRGFYLVGQGM